MPLVPPLSGEPVMPVTEAALLLGHEGTSGLRKRLRNGTLRGLAPHSEGNPSRAWMASRPQVEAEALNRGRIAPPVAPEETLADLRIEMLQGALGEAQQARLTQAQEMISELRSRLAEKDERIAQLERQLAVYARNVAELLARPAS